MVNSGIHVRFQGCISKIGGGGAKWHQMIINQINQIHQINGPCHIILLNFFFSPNAPTCVFPLLLESFILLVTAFSRLKSSNISSAWRFAQKLSSSTSKKYPPGNSHIPPGEKENHRLKYAKNQGDMLIPWRGRASAKFANSFPCGGESSEFQHSEICQMGGNFSWFNARWSSEGPGGGWGQKEVFFAFTDCN